MRITARLKQLSRRGVVFAGITITAVSAGLTFAMPAHAASTSCPSGFNGDSNAVVWCGAHTTGSSASPSEITTRYNKGDGHNSAASIHNIYGSNVFGISGSDIQNLSKNEQLGTVTRDTNEVILNGKVVATNVISAGRTNIGNSTPHTNNGTKFYTRPPKTSFLDPSLSAYVVMQNGQFKFAILVACGNPVTGKPTPKPPTPKPSYTINKEVAAKGSNNYAKSIKVQSGTHVVYRITVNSTGNVPVTNLSVSDKLPADAQFVDGTLKQDGKTISTGNFFSSGINVGTLKNGSSTVFTFEAIIGPKDTVDTCQAETLDNVGNMTATSLPSQSSTATVNKICAPKPTFECTSLSSEMNSRTNFTFTAKASAKNGATIMGYTFDFGDKTTKPVTTAAETTQVPHTYGAPGTYNAKVSVTIKVGGTTRSVTSAGCATTVTVQQPPASAECTDLMLTQDAANPRSVTATAAFTTKNGATLQTASFDWGDNSTPTTGSSATATHLYGADGSFTVKATLTFNAPSGTVPESHCQATIPIATVMPTCDKLTLDINNDTKMVTVTSLSFTANDGTYEFATLDWGDKSPLVTASDISGQQNTYASDGPFTVVATPHFLVNGVDTPETSAACQQTVSFTEAPTPPATPTTPTPPSELVNTGAGSVVGLFLAATAGGVFGYRRLLSRRMNHIVASVDNQ